MFSSRRKRHPLISGGIGIDAFGTVDRLAEVRYRIVALVFYVTHLSRMIVIVRQRVVHVSYVKIVPIGNSFGAFTAFFDEGVHLADADSTASNMGLAHQLVCDPPGFSLGHIYTLLLLPQKHTADWAGESFLSESVCEMYARNTNDRRHPRAVCRVGRLTLVPGGGRRCGVPGCPDGASRPGGRHRQAPPTAETAETAPARVACLGSPYCHRTRVGVLGRGLGTHRDLPAECLQAAARRSTRTPGAGRTRRRRSGPWSSGRSGPSGCRSAPTAAG